MQTRGRMHMTMNRLQCGHPTARLPARSHAPGAPEDDAARGGGHRPQSRRLGVKVRTFRRHSVSGRLPRADRGQHHEDRHGDPVGVHWVVVDNASPCRGRFHLFGASRWTRAISH